MYKLDENYFFDEQTGDFYSSCEKKDTKMNLAHLEFTLLKLLMESEEKYIPSQKIQSMLYGGGAFNADNNVRQLILKINKKFNPERYESRKSNPEAPNLKDWKKWGIFSDGSGRGYYLYLPEPEYLFPLNNLMARNNHFTGRDDLLETIVDGFYNKKMGIQLLSGMPGVGKTQTALEFAHRNTGRYSIIWWLNAEDEASLRVACKSFLDSRKELYDHDNVSVGFCNFFNNQVDHWLLVYDNAELSSRKQREIFSLYLPAERRVGNILITTRTCVEFYGISPINVGVFTQEEAVKYIRSVVGKSSAKGDKYLAKRLGYLPLPISYAAAYIKQTPQFNCTGYLKELSRKGIRIFEDSDNICLDYYKKTVRATFLISIESYKRQAEQGDSFMAGIVQFIFDCAYFPSSFIDLDMIAIFGDSLSPEFNQIMKDPFSLRKMVQILIASSLFYNVTISDSDPVHGGLILGIHRLLREVLAAELHPVFPETLDYFYSVYPNTIHIPLKLPNDILGQPWKINRNDVFSILPIIKQKYTILTLLGSNPIAESIFIMNNMQNFLCSFREKSNPPIDADYLIGTGFLESEDDFPDFVSSLPSRVVRLLYFYYLIWEILIETVLPSCGNLVGIKDLGRYTEEQTGWIVDLFASYFFCSALPPSIKQEDIDSSNTNLRPLLQDMITCMGVHLFRDIIMSDNNEQFAFFRDEGIGSFPNTENLMNDKNELLFAFLRDRGIDPFSVIEEPT